MSVEYIFNRYAEENDWNPVTQKDILKRYLEDEGTDGEIATYIQKLELDAEGNTDEDPNWTDKEVVETLLGFVKNQNRDNAFETYLFTQIEFEDTPFL